MTDPHDNPTASTNTPKPTHTPRPWRIKAGSPGTGLTWIEGTDGTTVMAFTDDQLSNLELIVPCVNACEGLDPARVATLKQQRDQLLTAILFVNDRCRIVFGLSDPVHNVIDKAIANATSAGASQEPTESIATLKQQRDEMLDALKKIVSTTEFHLKNAGKESYWYDEAYNLACQAITNATEQP